jgi:hypothetical protein
MWGPASSLIVGLGNVTAPARGGWSSPASDHQAGVTERGSPGRSPCRLRQDAWILAPLPFEDVSSGGRRRREQIRPPAPAQMISTPYRVVSSPAKLGGDGSRSTSDTTQVRTRLQRVATLNSIRFHYPRSVRQRTGHSQTEHGGELVEVTRACMYTSWVGFADQPTQSARAPVPPRRTRRADSPAAAVRDQCQLRRRKRLISGQARGTGSSRASVAWLPGAPVERAGRLMSMLDRRSHQKVQTTAPGRARNSAAPDGSWLRVGPRWLEYL